MIDISRVKKTACGIPVSNLMIDSNGNIEGSCNGNILKWTAEGVLLTQFSFSGMDMGLVEEPKLDTQIDRWLYLSVDGNKLIEQDGMIVFLCDGRLWYIKDEEKGYSCMALKDNDWHPYFEPKPWYENITKPVLCWVSDGNPDERLCIMHIREFRENTTRQFFCNNHFGGISWKYATPVKKGELDDSILDDGAQ